MLAPTLAQIFGGLATPEECAAITEPIFLRGATDLTGLEHFVNVDAVELLGCEVASLDVFARMPKLRSLRLLCSSVRDLSPLRGCAKLTDLEVNFTLVEDLAPLLDMPVLHHIKLFGNPLSDDSLFRVLPALMETRKLPWTTPIVEHSSDRERKIARQMIEAGLGLTFGAPPRANYSIVRPGVGGEGRIVDFLEAGIEFMEKTLGEDPNWKKHKMFEGFFTQHWVNQSMSRFRVPWLLGNHRDAWTWIKSPEAKLSDIDREDYFKFCSRFVDERFFVDTGEEIAKMTDVHRVDFPDWWKRVRHFTLAGVRPDDREVAYELTKFEFEAITRSGESSYKLGWLGYYNAEDRALFLDKCGMFPIGDIRAGGAAGSSLLAINLWQPDDRRIYEFWPRSLYTAVEDGNDPRELIKPVFSSWGALLAHTTALATTRDGRIAATS